MFAEIDQLNDEIWLNLTNSPQENLAKALETLKLSSESDYREGRAESLLNTGRCRVFLADHKKAKEDLSEALELFRLLNGERAVTGEMRTLNTLGIACFELQEYENALNYYFMALSESEINQNDDIRNSALNNIGEIHRYLNNREEALSYYHQALSIAESEGSERSIGVTTVNLGEIYLALNDLSEAAKHFNNAAELAERTGDIQMKADALFGRAKTMLNRNDTEAESPLLEALEIYKQLGDRICILECIYQQAVLKLLEKKADSAVSLLHEAMQGAEKLNQHKLQSQCVKSLSELYKERNDYKTALEYYIRFNELKKSLENENVKNRLKKITILYETEQTETEKEQYRMQSLSLEKSNKEIKLINEIGKQITSSLELDEIIFNTYQRMSEIVDIHGFGIALYDEDRGEIVYSNIVEEGVKQAQITVSIDNENSLTAWCLKNNTPVLINSREESGNYIASWESTGSGRAHSAIFMPMENRGRMIGCMSIQNRRKNIYTESDLDTVGAVSTFLAIALDNSRAHTEVNKLNEIISNEKQGLEVAYRKIAHMANHDSLTDLPNRHLLNELIERGIKLADRTGAKLAVLYMDLDNFKTVNDTMGHDSGDEVLITVAERITSVLRTSDTVARIGGDEFVAILPNISSVDGAKAAADKIINTLSEDFPIKDRSFQLGVSIGAAIFPDDDRTMTGLLLKSDKAMYKAKQAGKNRTCFYKK